MDYPIVSDFMRLRVRPDWMYNFFVTLIGLRNSRRSIKL